LHPTLKRSRHNRTPKNASPWCTLSVLHSDQRSTGGQSLAQCTHMQFTQVFSAPGSAQFFKQPLRMQACLCALLSRRLVQHGRARRLCKAPPRQGCVQAPPSGVVHALPHHKHLKSHPCAGNASVVVFPAHTGCQACTASKGQCCRGAGTCRMAWHCHSIQLNLQVAAHNHAVERTGWADRRMTTSDTRSKSKQATSGARVPGARVPGDGGLGQPGHARVRQHPA